MPKVWVGVLLMSAAPYGAGARSGARGNAADIHNTDKQRTRQKLPGYFSLYWDAKQESCG